jgi:hypothetical protein
MPSRDVATPLIGWLQLRSWAPKHGLGDRDRRQLTANRRPFLYFPLRHHFEQNFHVTHRLNRYRAVDYRPVETGGAARVAKLSAQRV